MTNIQCEPCNNTLGTTLVAQAKLDSAVRLALKNLRSRLPELHDSIEEGQDYAVEDLRGDFVSARFKKGSLETRAEKKSDGSIILDTKKGERNIRQMLLADGLSEQDARDAIRRYRDAPSDIPVRLSAQTSAIKRAAASIIPKVGFRMDERMPALMSYNFLCLLIGDTVRDSSLDEIRNFVRGAEKPEAIEIAALRRKEYRPFHELYPTQRADDLVIQLSLFHWIVYEVRFRNVVYKGPDTVLVEDLATGGILIADTVQDAKEGSFYRLGGRESP